MSPLDPTQVSDRSAFDTQQALEDRISRLERSLGQIQAADIDSVRSVVSYVDSGNATYTDFDMPGTYLLEVSYLQSMIASALVTVGINTGDGTTHVPGILSSARVQSHTFDTVFSVSGTSINVATTGATGLAINIRAKLLMGDVDNP